MLHAACLTSSLQHSWEAGAAVCAPVRRRLRAYELVSPYPRCSPVGLTAESKCVTPEQSVLLCIFYFLLIITLDRILGSGMIGTEEEGSSLAKL